ncbi:MAG TPA: serine/threonine-protein kinase [Gemmatimonadales bacterium]|nr:serine/threonine-protein kinase [Gemmatimonadales bacterium]
MTQSAYCTACGSELPAGATAGGPCRNCGATPTPPPTIAGADVDPAETLAEQIRRQLLSDLMDATLGEYEVIGELGRGGMASVFLAHEIALDRKVAIKVMAPALMASPGMAERFKREARTAANLSHPNILPIYAVRETDKLVFFVMKCLMGRGLDSVLKETGPMPVKTVQVILHQVAAGLAHAHRRGIVHRDVKPGNIMLDDDGTVVVTDFGIAKIAESEGLTVTGSTIGTPAYMSPEQCSGQVLTTAADQYSLGAVAYELLTGKVPFTAETAIGLMFHHVHTAPEPISSHRDDIPEPMAAAIMRMLAKDPNDRWPGLESAVEAMGHPERSSGFMDPVRDELATLASSGSVPKILAAAHTPRTPMPISGKFPGRRTGHTDPNAATIPVPSSGPLPAVPAKPGMPVWIWAAAGGVGMFALLIATGVVRLGSGNGAATRDTVVVPVPVTAPPPQAATPAPATPPPVTRPATRPAARTTSRGAQAATATATPPAATTTTAPAPAPAPAKPAATRAPTPTDLGDPTVDTTAAKRAIERVVERYRRAIESGRIDELVSGFPTLTDRQQRDFETLFGRAEGLQVELVAERTKIDVGDRNAEVQMKGFFRYRQREGGANKLDDYRKKMYLAYGPTGWRVTSIR